MKRVKDCKDMYCLWKMNSVDGQVYSVCILQFSCFTPLCCQNINKQNVNIAEETLTDYSFLRRYHYTKFKKYLKRRYQIRHWIPMFIGTPSRNVQYFEGLKSFLHFLPNLKIRELLVLHYFYKFYIIFSRFRTAINVLGDTIGAGIVAHLSKKELEEMTLKV